MLSCPPVWRTLSHAQYPPESLALWEALMGGIVGGVNAVLPAAFDPPLPPPPPTPSAEVIDTDEAATDRSPSAGFAAFSSAPPDTGDAAASTFTADFPSDGSNSNSNGNSGTTPAAQVAAGLRKHVALVSNPPVSAAGADDAAVAAAAAAFGAAVGTGPSSSSLSPSPSSESVSESATARMLAALLPLLARLPPMCPSPSLPSALPSLLLLAVKVLGAVSGRGLGLKARASGAAATPLQQAGLGVSGGGGGGRGVGDAAVDVARGAASAREAEAAVDFVRSCVREVWRHGSSSRQHEPTCSLGDSAVASGLGQGEGGVGKAEPGGGGGDTRVGGACTPPRPGSEGATITGANGTAADDGNGDDDDDWGDDDFQGAEDDFQGAEDADNAAAAAADTPATLQTAEDEAAAAVEPPLGETAAEAGEVEVEAGHDAPSSEGSTAVDGDAQREETGPKEDGTASACEEGDEGNDGGDAPSPEGSPANASGPAASILDERSEGTVDGTTTTVDRGEAASLAADEATLPHPPTAAVPESVHSGAEKATESDSEKEQESESKTEETVEVLGGPSGPDAAGDCTNSQEHSIAAASAGTEPELDAPEVGVTTPAELAASAVTTPARDGADVTSPPPPAVGDALSLVLAAARAVNKLLSYLLAGQGAVDERAAAIGAAAKAWGAIALTVPREVDIDGLAGPLRAALAAPVDECPVTARLALLQAVAVTVKAAAGQDGEGAAAAATLLRLLAPHALQGLRLEVGRAAAAAAAATPGTWGSVGGGVGEEPQEACLLEGVYVAQLAFQVGSCTFVLWLFFVLVWVVSRVAGVAGSSSSSSSNAS